MASPYALARSIWRRLLPPSLRAAASRVPPLSWLRRGVVRATIGSASHQDIYDDAYYAARSPGPSLRVIADEIVGRFAPHRVLDVGCGTGELLARLRERGVEACGLEHSRAALDRCHADGLDVRPFDLEHDDPAGLGRFDVVVSAEVAEHLPASCADRYVDLLAAAADGPIVFTAAVPGQGGTDHVNEQPHDYWIEKFRARGFALDAEAGRTWRATLREQGVASWYHENLMVFRRSEG